LQDTAIEYDESNTIEEIIKVFFMTFL